MSDDRRIETYLGDSVYAAVEPWGDLVLWLDNGMGRHSTIVLEGPVLRALDRFRADAGRFIRGEEKKP